MHIRLAKPCDATALARVYLLSATRLRHYFLPKLGFRFLRKYHEVLLSERNCVAVCLEDDAGEVVAFASGSLKAEEHMAALASRKLGLLWASIPGLARKPTLLVGMRKRARPVASHELHNGYIAATGPRLEFWGAANDSSNPAEVVALLNAWLKVSAECGAKQVQFEVDDENVKVRRIHLALGAHVVRSFQTADGQPRTVMCYELSEMFRDTQSMRSGQHRSSV